MNIVELEKRLAALERDVARLKTNGTGAGVSHPIEALERIHGTFEDDDAFREAMRLGRQWREKQRPTFRKAKAKRR